MPAKKRKPAEPIATPTLDDKWEWTKTFERPATIGEMGDFRPDLWELKGAQTAEEFHRRLAELIRLSADMTEQEREWLAEAVEKPWRMKRGAPAKAQRDWKIVERYFLSVEMGGHPLIPRVEAARRLAAECNISVAAAGRVYDRVMKNVGGLPAKTLHKK